MTRVLRHAVKGDENFLWEMLYYASHMDEEGVPVEFARSNPDLVHYVENWGDREGDLGFIAVGEDGVNAGAAWVRVMSAGSPLYRVVAQGTPELAVAVAPGQLGTGVGTMLLQCLIAAAQGTHRLIALSVRASNPALRLCERLGFATVAQITNRVGTASDVMTIALSSEG